jgi:hypothetical protein
VVKATGKALAQFVSVSSLHTDNTLGLRLGSLLEESGFEETSPFGGEYSRLTSPPLTNPTLRHVIQALYSLSLPQWSDRVGGFLAGLTALSDAYPPGTHPGAWQIRPGGGGAVGGWYWVELLLEILESTQLSAGEWASVMRLLPVFYAAEAKRRVLYKRKGAVDEAALGGPLVERLVVLYMR